MSNKAKRYKQIRRERITHQVERETHYEEKSRINTEAMFRPRKIEPRTDGQRDLIRSIDKNTVTFATGPAGSGKTYLAAGLAAHDLLTKQVGGIILIRPCIGTGPTMGFLPGDLKDKVSVYLRPLLDELGHFFAPKQLEEMIENGAVELASLEFCRGRSFANKFVILDESQNATRADFEVFLTRLGEGSKYVVTADVSRRPDESMKQSDLPRHLQGAVCEMIERLGPIDGVGVVEMTEVDIVRHPLVRKFLEAGL